MITGIAGQDGGYLAEFLAAKGYDVHGLTHRAARDGGARRRRGRARGRSRRVRHRARSSRGPLENERANAVRVAE